MKCTKSWKRDVAIRRALRMLGEGKTREQAEAEIARTMKLTAAELKREIDEADAARLVECMR